MCGPLSVPFGAIAILWANAVPAKLLWGCLAVVAFLVASYRVWRNERISGSNNASNLEQEKDAEIAKLKAEVVDLRRKPYTEELRKQAADMISRLSQEGTVLLRHLVANEPIEVGRRFKPEIGQEVQDQQLAIAYGSGIVRHNEVRTGVGNLIRTDYVVNPQFRPVLQDLLFK